MEQEPIRRDGANGPYEVKIEQDGAIDRPAGLKMDFGLLLIILLIGVPLLLYLILAAG